MRKLCSIAAILLTTISLNAQTVLISDGGFAYGCAGALYDSGGDGGFGYGNNEDFTITICADQTTGTHVRLNFNSFNLPTGADADALIIYDGMDNTGPIIGTFTGTGPATVVSAGFFNTSGCLTLEWSSDGAGVGQFSATLECYTPCAPPTAVATMSEAVPALVCQGEVITFDGSGSTAATGFNIAEYSWDFADGVIDSLSGPNVTHAFTEAGQYVVQLTVTDDNACENTNVVDLQVLVSTTPVFTQAMVQDSVICLGESVILTGGVTATPWSAIPDVDFGEGIYLPDVVATPFTSTITFNGFALGSTVSSLGDLDAICVSMEHSYMGDLTLSLTCPNGQTVIMHDQGGTNTFIGDALDTETVPPVPGTCYNYCWTNTATNGTFEESSTNGISPNVQPSTVEIGQNVLIPDDYTSVEPLSQLIGCPLNGNWTFTAVDNIGIDDGFICSWSVGFNPSLYPALVSYTPVLGVNTVDSTNWSGPGVVLDPLDPLVATATPTAVGTFDYVFSVTDNFGCTYDTTISLIVNPGITGPINLTGDQLVCDGDIAFINAPAGYDTYEWSNGAFGPNISGGPDTYICTISLGDCSLPSEPFVVTGAPSPDPIITGPGFNCGGVPAVLTTTENYASYQWSNNSNDPSITVGTGSYSVTVTNAEGCSSTSAPFIVTVGSNINAAYMTDLPSPQPLGATVIFTDNSSVVGSTIVNWQWIFDPVNGSSTQTSTTNFYENPGTYPVTLIVTAADGCMDTINGTFRILPQEIIIPNVFTPNGDNMNEALVFENLQYYKNNLTIFNRWGNKVYEKENYTNNWRASDVPDGTYFYVLEVPENNKEYTGHVTILR
ncbi:MAG: PKD domain-containing protein [Flavobacteriales bacterium]|nr:gliding motility-associated C-terminal domain-containing protein [Flavobacteriales bacterium]